MLSEQEFDSETDVGRYLYSLGFFAVDNLGVEDLILVCYAFLDSSSGVCASLAR